MNLNDVAGHTAETRFLARTSGPQVVADEIAYEVRTCAPGCPRALFDVRRLADTVIREIENSSLPQAVLRRAVGPVLRHDKLCVSISGCLNSCSQPQIADFGVQGRARPALGVGVCTGCGKCEGACRKGAVRVCSGHPRLDLGQCANCGDCASVCPAQALVVGQSGYSVLIGGKLGRDPQLARTLATFADEATLLAAMRVACDLFSNALQPRERLADAVNRITVDEIARLCAERVNV